MENEVTEKHIFCGFLEFEEKENSGTFVRKLVRLDTASCKLDYFPDKSGIGTEPRSSLEPDGSFNVCFLSMAADAASARPKVQNCFYIVVSGKKYYFKATSEKEKQTWINRLQDASRITVPQRQSLLDSGSFQTGFKVEVVGGVVLKTPMELAQDAVDDAVSDDDSISVRSSSPYQHIEEEAIKSGYCTKQGVFRKSWKRRYFVLSSSSFRYYRSIEDRVPIKIVKTQEILEARTSIGVYPTRENLFEVVTASRVFYIQADSECERDSWIAAVTRCLQALRGPKVLVTSI